MHNDILFTEHQRFREPWQWIVLATVNGLVALATIKILPEMGSRIDSLWLVGMWIVLLAVTAMVLMARLETTITRQQISVRFFPFHLKQKIYSRQDVARAYIRRYRPMSEYGGWGIRYGLFGKGKAYNVSGNTGIQLVLRNGAKILIGTRETARAEAALHEFSPERPPAPADSVH